MKDLMLRLKISRKILKRKEINLFKLNLHRAVEAVYWRMIKPAKDWIILYFI